jgi:hypothetical protein
VQWIAEEVWKKLKKSAAEYTQRVAALQARFHPKEKQLRKNCDEWAQKWSSGLKAYISAHGADTPSSAIVAYEVAVENSPMVQRPEATVHAFLDVWEKTHDALMQAADVQIDPCVAEAARRGLKLIQTEIHHAQAEIYLCHHQREELGELTSEQCDKLREINRRSAEAAAHLPILTTEEARLQTLARAVGAAPSGEPASHAVWKKRAMAMEPSASRCRERGEQLEAQWARDLAAEQARSKVYIRTALMQYYTDTERCRAALLNRERVALAALESEGWRCRQSVEYNRGLLRREMQMLVGGGSQLPLRDCYARFEYDMRLRREQDLVMSIREHGAMVQKLLSATPWLALR